MVYKVDFEADVQGLASTKRVQESILVYSKDSSSARHYAEGFITSSYSESYAILGCVPLFVHGLE